MTFEEVEKVMEGVNYLNSLEERQAFYKYAKQVPDGGTILDIGTAAGGSAVVFALASKPKVKVYTIDPMVNTTFQDLLKRTEIGKKVHYLITTSEEAVVPGKIDLMFIDGIHSYQGVTDDFNHFHGQMKPGGVVMFHDYYLYNNTIGKAVDDIVAGGLVKKLEIVDSLYHKEIRTGLFITEYHSH